jgi:hypothetical protein
MKDAALNPTLSADQRRLLQQLLKEALVATEQRLQKMGLEISALLDTEAPMETQVTQLRHAFLLGEQAALKFPFEDQNHWRVLRARLQPIVVAYQTHERFVQSVLTGIDPKNDDALIAIYKDRLQNSERFRAILFDLEAKIKSGELATAPAGDDDISALLEPTELHDTHKNNFRTEDDAASIQSNVLTQLSRQIKDLERREQEYQKSLMIKDREIAAIVGERDRTVEQMQKLERDLARTREESLSLRLVADAAKRAINGDPESIAIPDIISVTDNAATEGPANPLDQVQDESDVTFWRNRVEDLEAEVESMSTAAYNAYMASSDMSIVILFMLSSFNVNTFEPLGAEILRTVSTYGVKPTVSVMTDSGPKYFSGPNALTNANSIIESRRSRGRIVEEGATLIIYEERVVLLVPDMPVSDRPRYERLRDNLSTLVKGAAARAEAVSLAGAAEKQRVQMERLLMKSDDVFKGVTRNLEKQQVKLAKIVQLTMQDMRGGLGIAPGDPKSIALTSRMKKLEENLRGLFNADDLMDPAFAKNVAKVAANLKEKEK